MSRIINVQEFILKYPFLVKLPKLKLSFKINDSIAKWNNGVFNVYWNDEETVCEKTDDIHAANLVEMDIQTLTTMLMGYKRPTFLYECGRIKTEYYMLTNSRTVNTSRKTVFFRLFLNYHKKQFSIILFGFSNFSIGVVVFVK